MEKNFGTIVNYTRRPVDRRRSEDMRLSLNHEYLDHNPERRVNIRRTHRDRRGWRSKIINAFWKKDS